MGVFPGPPFPPGVFPGPVFPGEGVDVPELLSKQDSASMSDRFTLVTSDEGGISGGPGKVCFTASPWTSGGCS